MPAGQHLGSVNTPLQVTVRNRWPDGSMRFVQLAGELNLSAGVMQAVRVQAGAQEAVGSPLTLADLRSTGITAQFEVSGIGVAAWEGTDWDRPLETWVSGPLMSSWLFRKPVGSDAHLVAWMELRLFRGGQVEVLPWVENGYLNKAGPTSKSGTFRFVLGGRERFNAALELCHHQRTPLLSGAALSHWLGEDPEVLCRHDNLYLQATELVPSYSARVKPDAGVVTRLAASFTPLQAGDFRYSSDSMASTGYQSPIGLLPEHDVIYLCCDADSPWGAVQRNGYSAGRWALHYRDETTGRPIKFTQYPNLALRSDGSFKDTGGSSRSHFTPAASGRNPPQWDVAHSPSVGYLAYLVTGRWYHLEQVQFAATCNYLGQGDNNLLREGSKGIVKPCVGAWQTRSCAWQWRTLVQALSVTPDDDPSGLRAEFIRCVEHNIEHFHGRYVAQTNNPFGWVQPGETYNGKLNLGAPWQQDFVTGAFGYSLALDLPVAAEARQKLEAFFAWKARSIVGRLGERGAFWYINAAPYNMSISAAAAPDFEKGTGPWCANEAEVYALTYATPPAWFGNQEGVLAAEFMPGERSHWGNLMPALSYAVRFGVDGALAAYNRVTRASNWPALRDAFNQSPVWAVRPAVIQPAWLRDRPLNTWFEIPGTSGAGGSAIDAYCGMALDERSLDLWIGSAGGHNDASDNRVVSLRLADDAPRWQLRLASSTQFERNVAYYPDGLPSSRHTYHHQHFVPQVNRLMHFGARATFGDGGTNLAAVDGFNPDTNRWDARGTWADMAPFDYGLCVVRSTGEVYSRALRRWSPASRQWDVPITEKLNNYPLRFPMSHDSRRNQLFALQFGDGQGYDEPRMHASRVPLDGKTQLHVVFNSSPALTQWLAEKPTYAALDYDPDGDRFLFYGGQGTAAGRVYVIKPGEGSEPWTMSLLPLAAGSPMPTAVRDSGVYNRFRYVPALGGVILLARATANLWFLRLR